MFKLQTWKDKGKKRKRYYRKRGATGQEWKWQQGGWLNRYDFAYARREVVNQAAKVAPGVIKQAYDIDQMVKNRLRNWTCTTQNITWTNRGCLQNTL